MAEKKLTNRWLMLFLLLGIAILNYADRYLLSGLVGPIKADFELSDGMMGLLMGPAFAVIYTVAALPIARLADQTSRIAVLCAGCVVWSGFTALTAYAESSWMMAAARVGVGVGEAAYQAPATALIAAYFPAHQRGRALSIIGTAVYFGQILGLAGGPAIAADHGWRTAFEVIGGAGIIIAVTAFLIIREPPHEKTDKDGNTQRPSFAELGRRLVFTPSIRFMTFGMGLGILSGLAFGLWGPALFERAYGLSNAEAGSAFVLSFGLPGFLGVLIFGVIADRLTKKGMDRVLKLSAGALFSATLLIWLTIWLPELWMAQVAAVPAGLLGGGWSIGILAALQYVLPERDRATGIALSMLIVSMFGNVVGPWAAGGLSDLFAGSSEAMGLRMGLSVISPLGLVGAVLTYFSGRTIAEDRDRLVAA
ncbi:MAG: spinster family MFS transporter [Sphingomonadaceae bacterium]